MTAEHKHPPVIKLRDVCMRLDDKPVLSNVNLTVNRGDFMAITGPNGGGKTTLLRIILKLLKPTTGTVNYLTDSGAPCDALHIGYLPQKNMIDSRFPVTVHEVIASGLLGKGIPRKETETLVDTMLGVVELREHSRAPIGDLSGGQLQRALLGRALISRPTILVLDEPLSYLDKHFEEHIYRILADVAPHATVILVSHEMSVIATMASRHLIVDHNVHECTAHHHYVPVGCN